MDDITVFSCREEFRKWLSDNCVSSEGDGQINFLPELLRNYEPAYTNFMAMSPSVRKTYTKAYLDAKTDAGREGWTTGSTETSNLCKKVLRAAR